MSDKISFIPDSVIETVENSTDATKTEFKKGFKEVISQIFGISSRESINKEENSKKLAEKAKESGKTLEEQAKIESLRRQLHQQMIAPKTSAPEKSTQEPEDKIGTNEQMQPLGDKGRQSGQTLPPLAQPSMRHGERLKIRE